jgi:translation initiation factor SUI1
MSIENLKTFDPFADADEDNVQTQNTAQEYIHIRIQQRNGRKTLTTVQGIPPKFDLKKILKEFKKTFACNGTIIEDAKDKDKDDDEIVKDATPKDAPADADAAVPAPVSAAAAAGTKEAKDRAPKSTSKPSDKDKRSIGDVIQLQGDQRKNTREFLIQTLSLDAKTIKVHGF